MARAMGDNGEAFRTRIVVVPGPRSDGSRPEPYTLFEGPYATVGGAKSRATWAHRIYDQPSRGRSCETSVERAATNWEPVEV